MSGRPRPLSLNTSPCCVPAGRSSCSIPLSVGTSTDPPSAAWVKLTGTWQTKSLLCRLKIGCGLTAMYTCRSPGGGALALREQILFFEFDRLVGAVGDFFEAELDLGFEIEASLHATGPRVRCPAAAEPREAAAPEAAEDVVEHREDVADVHVREV